MTFFLFFSENRIQHFIKTVSTAENLHEMSKRALGGKIEIYLNLSSAENFAISPCDFFFRSILFVKTGYIRVQQDQG